MQTELQRQINGEWVLIKIEATGVYWDRDQIELNVLEAEAMYRAEPVTVKSEDIELTRDEYEYIVESIMDDAANDYQEVA